MQMEHLTIPEKTKGLSRLPDISKQVLQRVYAKHMAAADDEDRAKYAPQHIQEVKWNREKGCIEIGFGNGDWWHYDINGTFFKI